MTDQLLSTSGLPQPDARRMPLVLNITRWQVVLLVLALVAAVGLRVSIHDRFLPAQDYSDESAKYILLQNRLGYPDAGVVPAGRWATWTPVWGHTSALLLDITDRVTADDWVLPSRHLRVLRAFSVFLSTITLSALVVSGWLLGRFPAALAVVAVWGFHPQVLNLDMLALPDTYVYMFVALALLSSIRTTQTRSYRWLLMSLITGMLAIFSKFNAVLAVMPFCVLALVFLVREPRRTLPWAILYATLAIGGMIYLFVVLDPFSLSEGHRETQTFLNEGFAFMTDPWRIRRNIRFATYILSQPAAWFGLVVGGGAWFISRQRGWRTVPVWTLALLGGYALAALVFASSFTVAQVPFGKLRHVLPAGSALMLVWAALLAQLTWTLTDWGQARGWPLYRLIAALPLAGVVVGLLAMNLPQTAETYRNYQRTHINQVVWTYTDSSVPIEGRVWLQDQSILTTLWNRPWGGYDGGRPFAWWNEPPEVFASYSSVELAERDLTHMIFSDKDYAARMDFEAMNALLDEALLLKTLEAEPGLYIHQNPLMDDLNRVYIYRVLRPQHETDVRFGDAIHMIGYDLPQGTFAAGDTVPLRFFWSAIAQPADNYSTFVHLYPAGETETLAQADGPPALRPTVTWDDPNEILVGEQMRLLLPADLGAGEYRLAVGLYRFTDGVRLALPGGTTFYEIPVTVE